MDLRDLTYFETIAELGHLGRAAQKLNRSQPALTKSIQRLEESFGTRLFQRDGRRIKLTPVGELLQARGKVLQQSIAQTQREVRDFASGAVGNIRVGCASTMAQERLAKRLLERFGAQRTARFIKQAEAASAQGHVERDSDFVKGVTDLVAPIIGADGIIATLITPFIQQTPPTCDMITCVGHLREAAAAISQATGAVYQA